MISDQRSFMPLPFFAAQALGAQLFLVLPHGASLHEGGLQGHGCQS